MFYLKLGYGGDGYPGQVTESLYSYSALTPFDYGQAYLQIPEPGQDLVGYRYLDPYFGGVIELGLDYRTKFEAPPYPDSYWDGTEWVTPSRIPYTVDTETGGGSFLYGDPVVLQYVVSSSLAGTTIAYRWKDEAGLDLPGETASTLNLGGANALIAGSYTCEVTLTAPDTTVNTVTSDVFLVETYPVVGEFTMTRSGNDITTGLFTFLKGFAASTATIEVPAIPLTISYDPTDGFKTTGSPLLAADQVAEIFINGEFVRSVTIHSVDGTFNYNFSA